LAAKIGLVLHVPPNSMASWWCPGSTRFFCLTRPETTTVQFLPEQLETPKEKSMITRAEAERLVDEDIAVLASEQIRQGLTKANEAGLSDVTRNACLRALPAIERKIESLCPAIMSATERGVVTAYGPLLDDPQAMIPLCVLANSRGNCLATSVIKAGPFECSEEEWAQNMAKRGTRAAAWHEVDEAIQRKDARTAMACVTVLSGPSGWDKLMAAVQHIAGLGLQPAVWVIAGRVGKEKAGGALGVLALPPAINLADLD
jgi:hypothetical protein